MKLRLALQILLPILVLGFGAAAAIAIVKAAVKPKEAPAAAATRQVRVAVATVGDARVDVASQGTVEPLRAVTLASQVPGRIVNTHAALRAGGFFAAGDVLVELDPAEFQLAVVQQEAAVARADLRLLQERAEAAAAVRAWRDLEGEQPPDPLVAREPQVRDAEASLAAAKAQLERARLDLARTRLSLPFAGRVRSADADVGQTVLPGQALAEIHDLAFAEVRLPIPITELAFVDLPLADVAAEDAGTPVELRADFAGQHLTWQATIHRTEAEIDRRTRQLTAVARVAAPYGAPPPLTVGMFVTATIIGRTFHDVVTLPRAALQGEDVIWVVDAEQKLVRRPVEVLRRETDRVLLRGGVAAGERVCISALEAPSTGTAVTIAEDAADGEGR